MRTREEQIDSLYHGHNRYSTITQDAFRNHLIEAERRAVQRVRTEIAQDRDRLNWLEAEVAKGGSVLLCTKRMLSGDLVLFSVSGRSGGLYATLRDALDAPRAITFPEIPNALQDKP